MSKSTGKSVYDIVTGQGCPKENETMKVKVMQFQLPDGRQKELEIEIDDKCEAKYQDILSSGSRLTVEALTTGEVSQTIECSEFDYDITLTPGSDFEQNKTALEEMILRFDKDMCLLQQKEFAQATE